MSTVSIEFNTRVVSTSLLTLITYLLMIEYNKCGSIMSVVVVELKDFELLRSQRDNMSKKYKHYKGSAMSPFIVIESFCVVMFLSFIFLFHFIYFILSLFLICVCIFIFLFL